MRQAVRHVGNPCQKNRVVLEVVIRLEHKFRPVNALAAVLQQIVHRLAFVFRANEMFVEKRRPILGGRCCQYVGRRDGNVVIELLVNPNLNLSSRTKSMSGRGLLRFETVRILATARL